MKGGRSVASSRASPDSPSLLAGNPQPAAPARRLLPSPRRLFRLHRRNPGEQPRKANAPFSVLIRAVENGAQPTKEIR